MARHELIREKNHNDYVDEGFLLWNLDKEEAALAAFRASVRLKETPAGYFYIAYLLDNGVTWYESRAKNRPELIELLQRALRLPGCPAGAYKLLAKRISDHADPESLSRARSVLREGLDLHPGAVDLRVDLAWLLVREKDEEALTILEPALDDEGATTSTVWVGYLIAYKLGQLEKALNFLKRLEGPPVAGVSVSKVIGDLHLELGRYAEAVRAYQHEVAAKNPAANIVGLLSRAKVALTQWKADDALVDAMHAAELCFSHNIFEFEGAGDIKLSDGSRKTYDFVGGIVEAAKSLFDPNVIAPERRAPHAFAGLAYLIHRYESLYDEDEDPKAPIPAWLAKAIELEEHPIFLQELCDLQSEKNPDVAAECHLKYSLWYFSSKNPTRPEKPSYQASFELGDSETLTKTRAKKIHDIALRFFNETTDVELKKTVFLPFFKSAWSTALHKAELYKKLAEVASKLLDVAPEDKAVWWQYAYGSHMAQQYDVAQGAYEKILELDPKNTSALHNLSLLLETSGRIEEAMLASDIAAKLAPADEKLKTRNAGFDKIRAFQRFAEKRRASAPVFEDLSLKDRVYLGAVLRCCMDEKQTKIEPLTESDHKLAPTPFHEEQILHRLWEAKLLNVDPFSKPAALLEANEQGYRVNIRDVRWNLNLQSRDGKAHPEMINALLDPGDLVTESNELEVIALWQEVSREEAIEYLEYRREKVQLDGPAAEKTREYFDDLAKNFSTSQLYQIVHAAIKNTVTYQREKGIGDQHASNLLVKTCKTYGERALAQGWDLKGYHRDFNCEPSIISEFLYNRVLGVGDEGFALCPGRKPTRHVAPTETIGGELGPGHA